MPVMVFMMKNVVFELKNGKNGKWYNSHLWESFIKKNYGKFHNRSDSPPILAKIMEILKNINYFMPSKSGLVLK